MNTLPIRPHFEALAPQSLSPDQLDLLSALPTDFVQFLNQYNGGRVPDHTLNFYTGIPFEEPNPLAPSRSDFVLDFLGLSEEEDAGWEDIWGYNVTEQMNVFPEGIIVVARCNYGVVGINLNDNDAGSIWYQWSHYPSVAYHYEHKRLLAIQAFPDAGSPEAVKADQYALIERLADSWTAFLDSFVIDQPIHSDYPEIAFFTYETQYEQIRRLCAYHNIMYMAGKVPTPEQELILQEIDGGFLPKHSVKQIREDAPGQHSLYVLENPVADSWVLDRMLDVLMAHSPINDWHYHIVVEYARQAGYPKMEVDNSIADYWAKKRREQVRQAPPLNTIIQDGRENTLAMIQSLYLIGIKHGPVSPQQDQIFYRLASQNSINGEELKHIVRHREGLSLLLPKFQEWWEDFRKELIGFMALENPVPDSYLKDAIFLFEKMGLSQNDLHQALAAASEG